MTEWSNAKYRPLVFPLKESEVIETTTPDDASPSGVFVWPDDPEEKTIVLFELSQVEYTALSSAIDVGRDIAFSEDSTRLWWLWIRNMVEVPSFCAKMIECITDNPATLAAIVDALKSDAEFNEYLAQEVYRLTEGQIGGKLLPGDCDNSVLAGRAIALVNRLDLNNQDFLDVMEVGTNDEERVADLIGAIPVAETFPVDEVFLIAQDFLEDFAENYNAASTEGRKDELARLIYCAMRETGDCSITFERLFTVFQEKALSGLTVGSTIGDVILFLGTGDFSNDDAIFYGLMAIQMAFVLASRDFYGIEIGTISGIMRDALPSTRWEEWDPCATEWCYTQDLTSDASNLVLDYTEDEFVYLSEWVNGTGVIGARPGLLDENIPKFVLPAPARVVSVEFTITVGDSTNAYWYLWPNGETSGPSGTLVNGENSPIGTVDTDCDFFMFGVDRAGGLRTSIGALSSLTIRGTGENPFGSSTC